LPVPVELVVFVFVFVFVFVSVFVFVFVSGPALVASPEQPSDTVSDPDDHADGSRP
jgi:hypothetical protein